MRGSCLGLRIIIIGLVLCLGPVSSAGGADKGSLADSIHRLVLAAPLGKMQVGVRIESLKPKPSLVYEYQSERLLKPASNQKILTMAAAMAVLPEDFTYRTILARRGDDLVIIGAGDPSTGDPVMARKAGEPITAIFEQWVKQLKSNGLTSVAGNLLFDDFIFEQEHINPNWQRFNLQSWYAAPVGGLNFNDNCVDVLIKPAPEKGQPALVELVPSTAWIELDNTSKTASKGEPLVKRLGSGPLKISVSGRVSRPNDPQNPLSVAVTDPGMFFASTFRTTLASQGINVQGQTRRQRVRMLDGSLPADLQIVAIYERKLSELFWRTNKSSQNMFAEAVLKTLGAYAGGDASPRVGSYESGRTVVQKFLEAIGVPAKNYVLDDGSGLSHSNLATAKCITTVLAYMDRSPRSGQWRASLAVPGEKIGTLRRRMKDLKGKVMAKTGHISGVSALSGYVIGADGNRYAFSVLCNNTNKTKNGSSAARRLQDKICRTLADWQPATSTSAGG